MTETSKPRMETDTVLASLDWQTSRRYVGQWNVARLGVGHVGGQPLQGSWPPSVGQYREGQSSFWPVPGFYQSPAGFPSASGLLNPQLLLPF